MLRIVLQESQLAAETHCPYCALQCGMSLARNSEGLKVLPRDFPVNRGGLCQKVGLRRACLITRNG